MSYSRLQKIAMSILIMISFRSSHGFHVWLLKRPIHEMSISKCPRTIFAYRTYAARIRFRMERKTLDHAQRGLARR